MAIDDSESLIIGRDSLYYRGEFLEKWNRLAESLSKKYDLQAYSYSDELRQGIPAGFTGKQTDIGQLFAEIDTRYANRNVAALIVAGDGLINRGTDPLYAAEQISYPVFTVAMGDTNQYRDILINRVIFNQVAYRGNEFPLEISLSAFQYSGNKVTITVTDEENTRLISEQIPIPSAEFSKTIRVMIKASEAGVRRYRIGSSVLQGEISTSNNFRDVFVEVIDGRQKILLRSAAPHPDIAAIRQAIETNPNYEVVQQLQADDTGDLHQYNLVILHQLPSLTDAAVALLEKTREAGIPLLFVIGKQSNLAAFNQMKAGLAINAGSTTGNEAYAEMNNDFPLFSLPAEVINMIAEMPPLSVPFGQYQTVTSSEILMKQRIGTVATMMPLVLFNQGVESKTGIVAGEGLWRWRISCFMKTGSHKAFDELISKMVQYLAVKADRDRFRVTDKKSYLENEQVKFDAELYNESYELDNTSEVKLVVTDTANKSFPFLFSRTSNAYTLNAGSFPPGRYQYEATAEFNQVKMKKNGRFNVVPVNVESLKTVADHSLLNNLASRHDGIMVYPAELEKIATLLANREEIKTIAYSQKRFTDLVNLWWVLAIIIGLLGAEWFIRKRAGGY